MDTSSMEDEVDQQVQVQEDAVEEASHVPQEAVIGTVTPEEAPDDDDDTPIAWSQVLETPSTIGACSPSIDPTLHGRGVCAAVDRARIVARLGRRTASLLADLAATDDATATALLRAGQSLTLSTTGASGGQIHALPIQESMLSWSNETTKLSSTIKSLAGPSMAYFATQLEVATSIRERHLTSRQKCVRARQLAVAAAEKYRKVWAEAKSLAGTEGATTSTDMDSSSSLSTDQKRLRNRLVQVQRTRSKYKRAVEVENQSVRECQMLERLALETLQTLEGNGPALVIRSLVTTVLAEKGALMAVSLRNEMAVDQAVVSEKRNGGGLSSFLVKRAGFLGGNTESTGAMDAETLGLPETVGKLRVDLSGRLAGRSERVQAAKALAGFLDNLAQALGKVGAQRKKQLISDEKMDSFVALCEDVKELQDDQILTLCQGLSKTLELEGEECLVLTSKIRKIRSDKLDNVVLYGEKLVKTSIDHDDLLWKQLCEAARSQTRAEEKYRNSAAQTAKARERILSTDEKPNPNKVGKQVTKGLANVLSILPDGGEHAMRILTTGARTSMAQRSLKGAGEKETRGRQMLDNAVEATCLALEAYKANAETMLEAFEEEEKKGWDSIKTALDMFVELAETSRSKRIEMLSELDNVLTIPSKSQVTSRVNAWALKCKEEMEKNWSTDGEVVEFMLSVEEESSPAIDPMLSNMEQESPGEDAAGEDEDAEGEDASEGDVSLKEDVAASPPREMAASGKEDTQSAGWLRRQLRAANSATDMLPDMSMTLRSKLSMRNRSFSDGQRATQGNLDMHTEIFATYFWPDSVDTKAIPMILASFACSFQNEDHVLPFQYGRIFLSDSRLIFVSWTGKKLSLKWSDVLAVQQKDDGVVLKDEALQLNVKKGARGVLLSNFHDCGSARRLLEESLEKTAAAAATDDPSASNTPPLSPMRRVPSSTSSAIVPPDETLQKMDVVVAGTIRNISVQRFYELIWAGATENGDKPFYESWLGKMCHDIELAQWTESDDIFGPWCGEKYSQTRHLTFKVKRTTHLYIGPPIANVTQTHYCRVEGSDKCVVAMTVEFFGLPYADCFAVQQRWVARRQGDNDILLEAGVAVDFKKYTIVKNQIKAGTIEETTKVAKSLFNCAKAACIAASGDTVDPDDSEATKDEELADLAIPKSEQVMGILKQFSIDRNTVIAGAVMVLVLFLRLIYHGKQGAPDMESLDLRERIGTMEVEVAAIQVKLDRIISLLENRDG